MTFLSLSTEVGQEAYSRAFSQDKKLSCCCDSRSYVLHAVF